MEVNYKPLTFDSLTAAGRNGCENGHQAALVKAITGRCKANSRTFQNIKRKNGIFLINFLNFALAFQTRFRSDSGMPKVFFGQYFSRLESARSPPRRGPGRVWNFTASADSGCGPVAPHGINSVR